MLRVAVSQRFFRLRSTVRFYYTGNSFRVKVLTGAEVDQQLEKRGVNESKFTGRKILNDLLEKEIATQTLSVEDAAQLMSFQDLQRELQLRNIPTTGKESDLRDLLLQALKEEEAGIRECPTVQKSNTLDFQMQQPVEKLAEKPENQMSSDAYAQVQSLKFFCNRKLKF